MKGFYVTGYRFGRMLGQATMDINTMVAEALRNADTVFKGENGCVCVITGQDKTAVDIRIDKYFESYHPAGYGTFIQADEMIGPVRKVVIERWSSCD